MPAGSWYAQRSTPSPPWGWWRERENGLFRPDDPVTHEQCHYHRRPSGPAAEPGSTQSAQEFDAALLEQVRRPMPAGPRRGLWTLTRSWEGYMGNAVSLLWAPLDEIAPQGVSHPGRRAGAPALLPADPSGDPAVLKYPVVSGTGFCYNGHTENMGIHFREAFDVEELYIRALLALPVFQGVFEQNMESACWAACTPSAGSMPGRGHFDSGDYQKKIGLVLEGRVDVVSRAGGRGAYIARLEAPEMFGCGFFQRELLHRIDGLGAPQDKLADPDWVQEAVAAEECTRAAL